MVRLKHHKRPKMTIPPVMELEPKTNGELIKLDLSWGVLPEGHAYRRMDFETTKFPWPLKDTSVSEAFSGYLLNRIPKDLRMEWMNQLWRVLVPQGKCTLLVPYWSSPRAIQDSTGEWPPLCEQSFLYYNKTFRVTNREDHGEVCDFDYQFGYLFEGETSQKNADTQSFWLKHYINSVNDLQVILTKRGQT